MELSVFLFCEEVLFPNSWNKYIVLLMLCFLYEDKTRLDLSKESSFELRTGNEDISQVIYLKKTLE
jgi:hypothetical protein